MVRFVNIGLVLEHTCKDDFPDNAESKLTRYAASGVILLKLSIALLAVS